MATMVKLLCENCGNSFDVRKGKEKKTCSDFCKKELRKKRDEKYYITKPCKNCGDSFTSKKKEKKKYCSYQCSADAKHKKAIEKRTCLECGKEFEERIKYKRKFCSEKCRATWNSKPENKNSRIQKSKKALEEKYGVDSLFKLESFQKELQEKNKEKSRETIKIAQKAIDEKRKINIINRFNKTGYKILNFIDENLEVQHPDGHNFIANRKILVNRLNHNVELSTKLLPISAPKSTLELFISRFLKNHNVNHITNNRDLLKNKEIDILIPDNNLCIEINGLHWHSEIYLHKEYHIDKLEECNKINYDLLHFFEDEIIEKPDIVKSIILNKINLTENRIFARKCDIYEINNKITNNFLEKNHIQGKTNSKYKIGLYYNNELVSLMTFSKLRKILGSNHQENEYEMLRFCNKINTIVIGGANKLLSYFIKKYKPNRILSYANRRYSNGNLYEKLNFKFINKTPPNYFYVVNKQRKHRFKYRKNVLVKEGYDANKTEHEIMSERKIPRIYDCGNLKYELIL